MANTLARLAKALAKALGWIMLTILAVVVVVAALIGLRIATLPEGSLPVRTFSSHHNADGGEH
jgi:hypothetical protein